MATKETTKAAEIKTPNQREMERLEEYVTVKLFKDNRDYKDDLYVSINGENCQIKRGVPVQIKRKFALLIEQSEKQDQATMALIDEKSAEGAKALSVLG